MLFAKSRKSTGTPALKVSPTMLPDYLKPFKPSPTKYESDSELPSSKRVHSIYSPSNKPPKSITPHPGDVRPSSKARRGSGSSDNSSRLRAVSHFTRKDDTPLKSCLKPPKAYPERPPLKSRESSQTRAGGWPVDAASPYHMAIPYSHGLEPRHRSRRDSAPSEFQRSSSLSSSVRSHGYHGLSASEGMKPHHTVPLTRGRTHRVPMKEEAISLHWSLVNAFQKKRRNPPIFFDAAFDPRQEDGIKVFVQEATPYGPRQVMKPLSAEELRLDASTHTVLTSMDIVCPRGPLEDATITVQRPQGVRCIDVLYGIWDAYHRRVSTGDLHKVGEDYIRRCEPHFRLRCQDSPGLALYEERRGLRYIDLLRGSRRRIFKGLVQTSGPGLVWKLHFEDPE